MKFFNWVQNKLNAGQASCKKPTAPSSSNHPKAEDTPKEKFTDWSNGLLTIGTLGNRDQREDREIQRAHTVSASENLDADAGEIQPTSSPDLTEFTAEEVGQLQKELTRLLKRKPPAPPPPLVPQGKGSSEVQDVAAHDFPLDRFLNCPSSLEVDRTISSRYSIYSDQYRYEEEDNIDRTIRAIIGRCKQVCMESKKNKSLGKKSLSFLLKKMFVCATGSVPAPAPSLRDTLMQESRMEKLLRTMLSKKIYPQNGSRASSIKRYLVDTHPNVIRAQKDKDHEEAQNKQADGSVKWVKTDSEYIVLDLD